MATSLCICECFQDKMDTHLWKTSLFMDQKKSSWHVWSSTMYNSRRDSYSNSPFSFGFLVSKPASRRASLNKVCLQVPIHPVNSCSNMALTNLTPNNFFLFQTAQLLQAKELGVFKKKLNQQGNSRTRWAWLRPCIHSCACYVHSPTNRKQRCCRCKCLLHTCAIRGTNMINSTA